MINQIIFFLLILNFSFTNCINTYKDTNEVKTYFPDQEQQIEIGYLDFKLVGSLIKVNKDKERYKSHFEQCTNWTFKSESALNILKKMRKVEATEAYANCYQYPCWYEGKVSNGEVDFEITIYAGAYITLSNESEILHFIMEKKSDLFVDACDCCEYDD